MKYQIILLLENLLIFESIFRFKLEKIGREGYLQINEEKR
jgi:hypothetical protein